MKTDNLSKCVIYLYFFFYLMYLPINFFSLVLMKLFFNIHLIYSFAIYFTIASTFAEVFKFGSWKIFYVVARYAPTEKNIYRANVNTCSEIIKCISTTIISIAIFYVVPVGLGAKVHTQIGETLILALVLASMTIFPACLLVGTDKTFSIILGKYSNDDMISVMTAQYILLPIMGAWLGAFVIPLDSNASWHQFSTPNISGMFFGHFISHVVVMVKLISRRKVVYL